MNIFGITTYAKLFFASAVAGAGMAAGESTAKIVFGAIEWVGSTGKNALSKKKEPEVGSSKRNKQEAQAA